MIPFMALYQWHSGIHLSQLSAYVTARSGNNMVTQVN